jgi:hypothetical protein
LFDEENIVDLSQRASYVDLRWSEKSELKIAALRAVPEERSTLHDVQSIEFGDTLKALPWLEAESPTAFVRRVFKCREATPIEQERPRYPSAERANLIFLPVFDYLVIDAGRNRRAW